MTMIHYTTFVLSQAGSGLAYDVPFLVLGATRTEELGAIPLPTSIHHIGNSAHALSHAAFVLGELPVSDAWLDAVHHGYDDRAKVVVLRELASADINTSWAPVTDGVLGSDLPPWVGMLLHQQLHCATRDVPVTSGTSVTAIGIDPSAPTHLPDWADMILPGASGPR